MDDRAVKARSNLAESAAGWSARNRRWAVLGWLAFVVLAYVAGALVGQRNLTNAQMGNGESGRATGIVERAFPFHTAEEVLLQAPPHLDAGSAATHLQEAATDLVGRLRRLSTVGAVTTPYSVAGAATNTSLVSADGRSALVTFYLSGDSNAAQTRVTGPLAATLATSRAHPELYIAEFGTASATKALISAYEGDFTKAEHSSLPVTLLILLIAFGSLAAAGVPLLLGFTAVIGALGLIKPISHLYPVAQGQIAPVVLLVGLAVGVDYSMFYLRRKLEERRLGADDATALRRAAATSGRAVLVSGLTVMTAMAGMLLAGNSVFVSLGIGTMLVVAVAVIGSITVLPAVIARLGDRIEWGRIPVIARRRAEGRNRMWTWVIDRVLRRPALSAVLATGALLALAAPALHMRTVDPGSVGLPRSLPIVQTFDRIQAAFPGAPISAQVVITAADVTSPSVVRGVDALGRAVAAHPAQLAGPVVETVSPDRSVAVVSVSLAGTGTNAVSTAALATLRAQVLPETIGRVTGAKSYVTGTTAGSVDFNQVMKKHLPIVFVFLLGLSFVILLLAFRSLVVPLVTIALNMLSVGASYGLMVLVFQDGWLRSLIGAQDVGGVINWIPLFLLVVLFGLSMDYHVLVLSRIREGHQRGLPTRQAVSRGITSTAGVITSAALVMVSVFAIFATLSEVDFKQLGVALASAIAIDATIVRVVLLPALLTVIGERAWREPRWLGRLARRRTPDKAPPAPPLAA